MSSSVRRPALATGGSVSRAATLRQGQVCKAAARFAGVGLHAEFFMRKAYEWTLLCWLACWLALPALLEPLLDGVDLVDFVFLLAPDGVDGLPFLAEIEDSERLFSDFFERAVWFEVS